MHCAGVLLRLCVFQLLAATELGKEILVRLAVALRSVLKSSQ